MQRPETILGVTGQVAVPYSARRMKPLTDRATEGRVNAKGIPCLYLSTDRDTAMSEVRPWIGSFLTVAQFRVFKDLRVVDCSTDTDGAKMGDPSHPRREWEGSVWSGINTSFSRPVSPSDKSDNGPFFRSCSAPVVYFYSALDTRLQSAKS